MRQGQMGHIGYGQPENSDTERLSNLKRAIEQLEQRLTQAHAQPASMPLPTHPPHYDGPHRDDRSAPQTDLNTLQERLSALAGQLSSPVSEPVVQKTQYSAAKNNDEFSSAAAEIAMRQQALSGSAKATIDDNLIASLQDQSDKAIETVTKQFRDLKKELTGLKKQVSKPVSVQPKVAQDEVNRIAKAINDLQQKDNGYDEVAFSKLGKDIDALRTGVKADVEGVKNDIKRTVRRELGASNGNQTTEITTKLQKDLAERMAALTQDVSAASSEQASVMMPRVDHITSQVDALRTTVDGLPQTLSLDSLENGLQNVAQKIEALVQEQSNASAAAQNALSSKDLSSIESRLDEVARSLVAVSSLTEKVSTPDLSGVERVEARMADLARAVDVISEKDTGIDTINELAVRIEGLTERLGSFEKYAETGDLGGASQLFAAPDIGVLEDQIRQLTDRIDSNLSSAAPQSDTGNLEAQIAQLTARFEEASAINSTAAQMSNLEAQVGQIIRNMNKVQSAGDGTTVDLSSMEERLAGIESQIVNGQNVSVDAAQQAAQQAVSMMGEQSAPGQIISALSEDLKTLQAVAENGSQQSIETTERVHQTLAQVVDRLNAIENAIGDAASAQSDIPQTYASAPVAAAAVAAPMAATGLPDMPQSSDEQMDVIQQAAVNAGLIQPHRLEDDMPLQVDAPALDPTTALEAQADVPLTADLPGYDVDQPATNARSNLDENTAFNADNSVDAERSSDELRPDAVAAARRALQATTAEMNAVREEAENSEGPSGDKPKRGLSMPGGGGSKLRKPLIMGAAALLLAVVAFKGFGMLTGGKNDVPVAKVETKVITPQSLDGDVDTTLIAKPDNMESGDSTPRAVGANSSDDGAPLSLSADTPTSPTDSMEKIAEPKDPLTALTEKATQQADDPKALSVKEAATDIMQPKTVIPVPQVQELSEPTPVETVKITAPVETETPLATFDVPSEAGSPDLVAAAKAGDEKALFQIGMRYSEGNGVKRDLTESSKWFQRSADKGFAPAQYSIGSLYEKGIGVERDVKQAANWYEKAAAQGNARAMHNLAVIYAMGNPPTVQPQMDKAVGWFQKAANFGIKDSQFNLGILYGQGMGVPQNLTDSFKWFALAAKTGDADAAAKRDEVANAMEPTELAGARKIVNDWAPKSLVEKANRVAIPKEWQGRGRASASKTSGVDARGQLKQAQALLNKRGFNVGTPDGLMGPNTKRAIMEFQRSAGIPITGRVDGALLKALDLQT